MKTQTFTANVTRTKVFRVEQACLVYLDITFAAGTGSLTITVERDSLAAHDVKPATDSTQPLTGASLTVAGSLTTAIPLGPGEYGITIGSASSLTLYFHASGKWVSESTNAA